MKFNRGRIALDTSHNSCVSTDRVTGPYRSNRPTTTFHFFYTHAPHPFALVSVSNSNPLRYKKNPQIGLSENKTPFVSPSELIAGSLLRRWRDNNKNAMNSFDFHLYERPMVRYQRPYILRATSTYHLSNALSLSSRAGIVFATIRISKRKINGQRQIKRIRHSVDRCVERVLNWHSHWWHRMAHDVDRIDIRKTELGYAESNLIKIHCICECDTSKYAPVTQATAHTFLWSVVRTSCTLN